jgi:hypothetical protein
MSKVRFFTDEDVFTAIAPALRKAGYDAVSALEVGRLGESDESHLAYAAGQGRVFFTFNAGDFVALHGRWLARGQSHSGIVVSNQRSIGDCLRRLLHLASVCDADSMLDRLEFLSDW